jgi:2-oxoacid:acceptor oxidoreductase delta subunit (pyruvate/2-ketoisovalerate family)
MSEASEAGVIKEAGSAIKNKTGSWRTTSRPLVTPKCIGCGICVWYCPEGAIKIEEKDGKKIAVIDYEHCKGCMLCAGECPQKAIEKEDERK